MLKQTMMESVKGCRYCRYEHPTRGIIETLSYPCGRLVYIAKGFERRSCESVHGGDLRSRARKARGRT
jgi:hypothetical protein